MVNMNVGYVRPNRSLMTLRDEVYRVFGYTPARASEFVTGYKSPGNFTGHNADSNGIVHAVDIFTDNGGNLPEDQGRDLAEQLRVIGAKTGKFAYLIHDMCPTPGIAWPRIAGAFNGWVWQVYTGSSPHTDHIHISTADLYWGDPAPVSAAVYDSTAPWGIRNGTSLAPAGGRPQTIKPAPTKPKEWDEMASKAEVQQAAAAAFKSPDTIKAFWGFNGNRANTKGYTMWNRVVSAHEQALKNAGEIAGLRKVVDQLAAKQGIDITKVDAAVQTAVKKALADGTVNVDITVGGTNA